MAKVQSTINRRNFVGMTGAAGATAFGVSLGQSGKSVAVQGTGTPAATPTPLTGGIQDLTHILTPSFPVFPGFQQAELTVQNTVAENGFYTQTLSLAEHTGTHMDAPAHFIADGSTAELLTVERLIGPLAVIDISGKAATDDDAMLTVDDIADWEQQHGVLPTGVVVAMYSGWETRLETTDQYLNPDAAGQLHFPGFDPEVAAFLIEERDIRGVGVDTLSIDIGASMDFGVHLTILGAEKYGLENLANLANVPPSGATIFVGGPKHEGASGGPARVIAVY